MDIPAPRGELSNHVFARLRSAPRELGALPSVEAIDGDDCQVTLFVLQELSFRPFVGVSGAWEDEPSLLRLRAELEGLQERELRELLHVQACRPTEVADALLQLIDDADGPSLSTWVEANATLEHLREFVTHRSAYQLKEADPHSFAIPRLRAGRAKTALLEIQLDEYGHHEPSEAHAELFRGTLAALGLDPDDGDVIDLLPAATLRTNTVLNSFTRSRRLLGACLGHLAVFEMTSVEPMARYASACRRLLNGGRATQAARFFDVHVAADGLHERIALERLVGGFAAQYPEEASELLFGAAALMKVEGDLTSQLLTSWNDGRSSLRRPLQSSVLPLLVSAA